MTHRAETILDAIATTLTGLTTTGTNVTRGRVYPVTAEPALSIFKGDDDATESEEIIGETVRELNVIIQAHLQALGNPETVLNQIAAEVYAAMRLDITLGLAYVFDTRIVGDAAPEIEDSQDLPTARMSSTWLIIYSHSDASAEA